MYSPNSIETENEKVNNFIRTLGTLKHSQILVLGDFNRKDIDWLSLSAQSETDRRFIEAVKDSFLTQHISQPTRVTRANEPSLIDLLFTTHDKNIENIEYCAPIGKSDHSLIKFSYRFQLEKQKIK